MPILRPTIASLFAAALLTSMSLPASAGAGTPDRLRYIVLSNTGAYTISDIWVKWKEDGKTKSQKFTGDLVGGQRSCFDLAAIGPTNDPSIPDGAEVWIEAQIALGEKKSCRKDKKHYFKQSATNEDVWYLKMGGETLTNNNCKNTDKSKTAGDFAAGNSLQCSTVKY